MGKRGPKPNGKVKIKWSPNFAYAIGLIATDGCLSTDGRHIILTSKDVEQLDNFSRCLAVKLKIGTKNNGHGQVASLVQFGDVLFYSFLESIGLTKAKSLTMGRLAIPEKYFFDFLRGCFDGDGCFYSYWDPRWRSSFMYYSSLASGSEKFILWIQQKIFEKIGCKGRLSSHKKQGGKNPYYQLRYAKKESIILLSNMYYSNTVVCLSRKKLKINKALDIVGMSLEKNMTNKCAGVVTVAKHA